MLLIVSMILFVVFFGIGPGSIPWIITAELFTQVPRPAAVAIATLVNWSGNLLVGFTFPLIASALGDFSFLPFVCTTAVFVIILFYYLPETKGRSVEQIARRMEAADAWKCGLWKNVAC